MRKLVLLKTPFATHPVEADADADAEWTAAVARDDAEVAAFEREGRLHLETY